MSAFTVRMQGHVAIITFDAPNTPVNIIHRTVGMELDDLLRSLFTEEVVQSIVLRSGKAESFIAGADIKEFVQLQSVADAVALSRDGQRLMQLVADAPKPVVAAIHGTCLGGGLELVLACQARVASDHPSTMLGLPETQLGLLPGAGGSNRLPRLIGLPAALDLILQGKSVPAAKARRLGLVDEVVSPAILLEVACQMAESLARGERLRRRRRPLGERLLQALPPGRSLIFRQARQAVLDKSHGHYPAPLRAIEVIDQSLSRGMTRGLEAEAQAFGELAMTTVSRRLVEIFQATTALKKDDGVPPGMGVAQQVRRLGVVGSGFMGAGIAGTAALTAKVEVRLRDTDLARVGRGLRQASGILAERHRRGRLTRMAFERQQALLSGTAGFEGFAGAQLVVEAVFEDLTVKQDVVDQLENVVAPDAVIATNTSTIPVHQIAERARHPERVLGMHFFSPVERMPLLEVIPTERTSADAVVTAVRFGRQLGKTVIVVADSPGFWVNRILLPYLNEAGLLLEQGVPIALIDQVMTEWGLPVGPITLMDEVGLDVGEKAGKSMYQAFGERLRPSRVISVMRADDRLGRKNGRGFHFYRDGEKAGVDASVYQLLGVRQQGDADPRQVQDRLVMAMLNEAALAMSEGVVGQPRDGDIGALFGIGYPPFRGGPLRTIDTLGAGEVVTRLERLESACGPRFRPAPVLVEMARIGGRWYPATEGF